MNPAGIFLVFAGALVVVQVTAGSALARLNLFGPAYNPGTALGHVNPDGSGSGGMLLPPGTGLNPTSPTPPPLVAPQPGRPIPGDIPGVTSSQPNGLGGFLDGLTK